MLLTLCAKDLVAHGKTWKEIAEHIDADGVIFQDLGDLKASCIEAAEGPTEIDDFEVGVFCGKYVTDVPEGYFEHLSRLRGKEKKAVARALEGGESGQQATVITNSGPVNVGFRPQESEVDGHDDAAEGGHENGGIRPEQREDIRYVTACCILDLCLLTDALAVFTTLRVNSQFTRSRRARHKPRQAQYNYVLQCDGKLRRVMTWVGCSTATVDGKLTRQFRQYANSAVMLDSHMRRGLQVSGKRLEIRLSLVGDPT